MLTFFFQLYYRLRPVQKDRFLLGTYIRITAYGPRAERAVERAMAEMAAVEDYTSSDKGTLALINENAGSKEVKVGPELFSLIKRIRSFSEATDGLFNPLIGPLVELWGFGYNQTPRLPRASKITRALPLVNRDLIVLDEKEQTVYLKHEGMRLDLGGVAKGYAVDRAWETLKASSVWGALINGGESSIRVLGTRPNFKPWRIGLAHPRKQEWIGIVHLPDGKAVGTSADTQRFFEEEGRRYSHLINPYTGYPPADLHSATVIMDSALEADIYSTAVFVAEGRDRVKLLDTWQVEGIVMDTQGKTGYTSKIKSLLR